jgi:hypothetical protein
MNLPFVFVKGQTLQLGNLGITSKKETSKVICKFNFILAITHGRVFLGCIGVHGCAFSNFVGVPGRCSIGVGRT